MFASMYVPAGTKYPLYSSSWLDARGTAAGVGVWVSGWRRAGEPIPPVCADACGKLAQTLDDRKRYSDHGLERLDVTVRADWSGRGSRSAHEKEVAA